MKGLCVLAFGVLLVTACSSESEGPACKIEGTYLGTASNVTGTCAVSTDPVTDTITARTETPPDFNLEIQGFTGACSLTRVAGEACKVQGKCDITVTDAIDPANATGTVQYSWTFTNTGFSGTSAVTIPPGKSLPNGCSGRASVTGTRQ
jgi:hypothetical protein